VTGARTPVRVAVVGAVTFDELHRSDGGVERRMGGSGVYGALGASLLAPAAIISVVGDDFGDELLDPLRQRGVNVDAVARRAGRTFRWACRYDATGDVREQIYSDPGVYAECAASVPDPLRAVPYLALTAGNALQNHACADQMHHATFIALDTIEREIRDERDKFIRQLPLADLVSINDAEAASLIGWRGGHGDDALSTAAARWLRERGHRLFILKRGSAGADVCEDGVVTRVAAVPGIRAIDPTGAGDTFVGAALSALARGDSLVEAARWGCAVASFTIEAFGTAGILRATRGQAEARLAKVAVAEAAAP